MKKRRADGSPESGKNREKFLSHALAGLFIVLLLFYVGNGTDKVYAGQEDVRNSSEADADEEEQVLMAASIISIPFATGMGSYGSNSNARTACDYLDGAVVEPGEVFSYNECVGPRTEERGFCYGTSYNGDTIIRDIGGGICKTSTMLYNACLKAGLEIVERYPHTLTVNYVEGGLDAAVAYGIKDFRFRNSLQVPVTIRASYNRESARFTLGLWVPKYAYEETTAVDGRKVLLRRVIRSVRVGEFSYDSYVDTYRDGELVSTEGLGNSTYMGKGKD